MSANRILIGLVLLVFFYQCTKRSPEAPVVLASTGTGQVLLDDYLDGYREFLFQTGAQDNLFFRNAFLSGEIDRIILLAWADTSGFRQRADVQEAIATIRGQTTLNAYYQNDIKANHIVPEAAIREAFRRSKINIHARHLFTHTLEEAQELRRRLAAGELFESLARETFSDSILATTGGDLGFFTYNEMEPAFEDAAYALDDGEISQPVRTRSGFSIIQVLERVYNPIITELDYQLHRDEFEFSQRGRQLVSVIKEKTDQIITDLQVDIQDDDVELLMAHLPRLLDDSDFAILLDPTLQNIELNTSKFSWDFAQIVTALRQTRDNQRRQMQTLNDLRQVLLGLAARQELLNLAEKTEWYHSPEFQHELKQAADLKVIKLAVQDIYGSDRDSVSVEIRRGRYRSFVQELKRGTELVLDKELLESFSLPDSTY